MVQEALARTDPQLSISEKPALAVTANDIVEPDLFVTVKVLGALVAPMAALPNARDAGLMVTGAAPVPVRLLVCVPAESTTVSVPVREPVAVGAKLTLMEQVPFAAREAQLLPVEKSPPALMLVTLNAAVPVFFRVNVLELEPPIPTDPNELEAGDSVAVWPSAAEAASRRMARGSNSAEERTHTRETAFMVSTKVKLNFGNLTGHYAGAQIKPDFLKGRKQGEGKG